MHRVKISGERGRWVAKVGSDWLAVIHTTWRQGPTGYADPMVGVSVTSKRYAEFMEALETHDRVIIQRDADPQTLARDGYVGVFKFKDLRRGEGAAFELTLTERWADPAP